MSDQNRFLLCTASDGAVKVDMLLKDETVWLTQKTVAELSNYPILQDKGRVAGRTNAPSNRTTLGARSP